MSPSALCLHPRTFLPAAPREPLAQRGRGRGLGRAVPRLERADHARMLRPEHALAAARRRGPDRPPAEQLRLDELQLRPDAPPVDGRARPRRPPGDRRGRPPEPRAPRRPRQCPGPELQSHHHATGEPARQGDPGRLGDRRFPPPVRPACPRGCGWRRRRWTSRRWRCWPRRASGSRSWRPGRPGGGGSWATKAWEEIPGGIDPSRAYLCRLPSGRSIVLFFYDAIVSHDVAFRRLLDDGERFLKRIFQGFDDRREHAQLMHIATDGESYGHHHPHGDMALVVRARSAGRSTRTSG